MSKDRFRHQKEAWDHVTPAALGVSLAKSSLIRAAIDLAAEDGKRLKWPASNSRKARMVFQQVAPGFVKDVLIATTHRGFEHAAFTQLTAKRAGQLMRDPSKDAVAKFDKFGSRRAAAMSVFPSTFRGSLLPNAALFTVEALAAAVVRVYRSAVDRSIRKKAAKKGKKVVLTEVTHDDQPLGWELIDLLARCMGTVVFEAAGASVGTLILPGTGTVLGHFVGGLVCWLV